MTRTRSFVLAVAQITLALVQSGVSQTHENSSSTIALHRRVGTCELVQKGALVSENSYASVWLEGQPTEIYSPELENDDFIAYPVSTPKALVKLARKSGFRMKSASEGALTELPKLLSSPDNSSCPPLDEGVRTAERDRTERRLHLQSKLFKAGSDGVKPPKPLSTPQPSAEPESADSVPRPSQPKFAKTKIEGTVSLSCIVTSNGDVEQVRIIRSLSDYLDKKAAEAVARYKFDPARKNGLPVPIEIDIQVDFHLH